MDTVDNYKEDNDRGIIIDARCLRFENDNEDKDRNKRKRKYSMELDQDKDGQETLHQ